MAKVCSKSAILSMDLASVELFSLTYLELNLARKCTTQQTSIHSSHVITFFLNHVHDSNEAFLKKKPFQQTSGIKINPTARIKLRK